MPNGPIKTCQPHIGNDRTHTQCFSRKVDRQCMANKTAATIGSDEEPGTENLLAALLFDPRRNAIVVLLETDQLRPKVWIMAQFGKPLPHDGFGCELRQHQRRSIGLGCGREDVRLCQKRHRMSSIRTVLTQRRIGSTCRSHTVDETEILENLHRPGLDALAARSAARLRVLLDQSERNPASGKVDGKCQACGPRTRDQDVCIERHWQLRESMCNIHVYEVNVESNKNVNNAHDPEILRGLHTAIIDLVDEINRPRRDDRLIEEAGIPLDRALFPLLARVWRYGPIGVVDLADRTGRDHTTISRQMTKLEELDLIERRPSAGDRRVREATVTEKGRDMVRILNAARERLANRILVDWTDEDLDQLRTLLRRFADDLMR